jgi:DNA repair ATPase RecN
MASKGKKSVAQINREIDEVLRRRRAVRVLPGVKRPPETQRDVLRDLNRKYKRTFEEPWQMLAALRRAADQLQIAGQRDSDLFQRVVSDHDRLRRAAEDPG